MIQTANAFTSSSSISVTLLVQNGVLKMWLHYASTTSLLVRNMSSDRTPQILLTPSPSQVAQGTMISAVRVSVNQNHTFYMSAEGDTSFTEVIDPVGSPI